MKLRTTLLTLAAVAMVSSFFLSGCTTEDTGPGTGSDGITRIGSSTTQTSMEVGGLTTGQRYVFAIKGGSGTVIKGLSSNGSTSIIVSWTRGGSDVGVDSIFYKKVDVATSSLTVDGTLYTAQTWATATKFGPFTLYDDASDNNDNHPSGLLISESGITTVSTRFGTNVNNVDVKLRRDNSIAPPYLVLEPGFRNNINDVRKMEMSAPSGIGVSSNGALNDYYTSGLLALSFSTENTWIVPILDDQGQPFTAGNATMIPVRTTESDGSHHYAIIEVESHENASVPGTYLFWQQNGVIDNITVNVYYQTVKDLDYAGTHEAGNGGH